jgi:3-methyladenine DNA glycosylase AlkC
MPQVSGDDLSDAISILKKNNIPVSVTEVLPSKLKHSQKQINKEKVANIIKDMRKGKKMPPCIISKDQWMVDGHHRNVAYKIEEPNKEQKYIQIQLPRDQAIALYKQTEGLL